MKFRPSQLALFALAAGLATLALRHYAVTLSHPWPVEYGEGVNLIWANRAAAGEALYPGIDPRSLPRLHHPYPPLFALLNGALSRFFSFPHPFFTGRLLGTLGVALAAQAVFALVRRRAGRATALGAALLFLLSPMVLRFGPMMRVDALGVGLSLQAARLLRARPKSLFLAGLLAGLAVLAKPTHAAAAGALLWTAFNNKNPKSIGAAMLGLALFPCLVLAVLFFRESPRLFLHLWALQRLPPDFSGAFDWIAAFAGQHLLLAVFAFSALRTFRPLTSLRVYGLLALVPPLATAAVTGSQENYLMELWALACVVAARAWPVADLRHPRAARAVLFAQLLLFLPVAPAPVFTRTYGQELPEGRRSAWTPTPEDLEVGRLVFSELEIAEGPVLSADPGFAIAAGHGVVYQPFQFERLAASGKWDDEPLRDALEAGRFSHVLLKGMADEAGDAMFRPEIQSLIDTHYELHRVLGPWRLYRIAF